MGTELLSRNGPFSRDHDCWMERKGADCTMLTVTGEGSREHAFKLAQEVHMLMVFWIMGSCRTGTVDHLSCNFFVMVLVVEWPVVHLQDTIYHAETDGWKKLSGDDVVELHYKYHPVVQTPLLARNGKTNQQSLNGPAFCFVNFMEGCVSSSLNDQPFVLSTLCWVGS
ncbi:unnamed protein product [Musa acuminata subsp. burmannicoides]